MEFGCRAGEDGMRKEKSEQVQVTYLGEYEYSMSAKRTMRASVMQGLGMVNSAF